MYSGLTKAGKSYITNICAGTSRSLLDGKSKDKIKDPANKYYNPDGVLPFCTPKTSASKIWYSQARYNGNLIQNNQQLGVALIDWFNKYGKIFEMDANIIAAQAWAESAYNLWIYPLTSTASSISQITSDTIYSIVVKNKFATKPEYKFTTEEIAAITKNLSGDINNGNNYDVGYEQGRKNRPILHQNMIDNPEIMIKAQYAYMKFIASQCDGIASSALFGYNRGPYLPVSPSYTKSIAKAISRFGEGYEKEGIDYVYKIFQLLGNQNYKKEGWFGYFWLKLNEPFDKYTAEVDESNIA
jgi:hypothetical protein